MVAFATKYRLTGKIFPNSFGSYRKTSTFAPTNKQTNEKCKRKTADQKGRFHITLNGKGRQFFPLHQQTNEVFTGIWYRKLQTKLPVNICEKCRTENRLRYSARTATIWTARRTPPTRCRKWRTAALLARLTA